MIGRLKGIILEKQAPHLLLDVQGVGYELQLPMSSFYPLGNLGEKATLHTHLAISETAHQLFGFYSEQERQLFKMLIKISGVGPKMALAILSGKSIAEFSQCVANNDVAALTKIPGVGKKTAERLIIESRDKLKKFNADTASTPLFDQTDSSIANTNDLQSDAESALIALGYKPTEATKAISRVLKEQKVESCEELIRLSLKSL